MTISSAGSDATVTSDEHRELVPAGHRSRLLEKVSEILDSASAYLAHRILASKGSPPIASRRGGLPVSDGVQPHGCYDPPSRSTSARAES